MNVILFLAVGLLSYELAKRIVDKKFFSKINNYIMVKNDEYYAELLRYYEKNKKVKLNTKLNVFHKINILIDRASLSRNILINPITILLSCVLSFVGVYMIIKNIFEIPLLSFIISLPALILPIVILSSIASYKEQKIEKVLLNFLLQLKNYTRINNDIIYAFQEVKVIEPLQSYIDKFLLEINRGIKFEIAMEHLKEKIHIKSFLDLLNHIQYCYLYGGNFSELIRKNYETIDEMQKEKAARMQETRGARLVLLILIALDLFVYFTFINSSYENYRIMKNSFVGTVILYWNFISMWLLLLLSHHVKKLDY
ncbi:MAG: hypothetical protein IJ217_00915 [Clostridia bacterium]|nr:hypothetical protein [Clostridia bacterium]